MPKIGIVDIKPDENKLAKLAGIPDTSLFGASGIRQYQQLLNTIKDIVKEAKGLQNPEQNPNMVNPNAVQPVGVTKDQLFNFGKLFLDNLINQGYGDKKLPEVINDIPLTIKQIRGYLK